MAVRGGPKAPGGLCAGPIEEQYPQGLGLGFRGLGFRVLE